MKYFQLEGTAIDRYIENDSMAARLTYEDGLLNGPCSYYYMNGTIREKGEYSKNKRIGRWEYYFENGQKSKTIDFNDNGAFLVDCYTTDGKVLAQNGNGRFEGEVVTGTIRNPLQDSLTGNIKNGLPDGEWKIYTTFLKEPANIEKFSSGKFKRGTVYGAMGQGEYNQSFLSRIESIHPEEKLDYYGQSYSCTEMGKEIERTIGAGLFQKIHEGFAELLQTNSYKDYSGWVFLDVRFDGQGRVMHKSVLLSQTNEELKNNVLKMLDLLGNPGSPAINAKSASFEKFCIVLLDSNQIIIPEELLAEQRRNLLQ